MLWSPHFDERNTGYQAYRFHKRYYNIILPFSAIGQDAPSTWLISQIPRQGPEYLSWLATQRQRLSEREKYWEKQLAIQPSAVEPGDETSRTHREERAPRWLIPIDAEWVFIVDLDFQVLYVGDGLHFALEELPHIDWKGVIDVRRKATNFGLLQELFPERRREAVVPSADEREQFKASRCGGRQTQMNVVYSQSPSRQIVIPKSLADIPWRRRHGPLLRLLLFSVWSNYVEIPLATALPQWGAEDTPFQEIAFTIMCLAAGGKHVRALSASLVHQEYYSCKVHALFSGERVRRRQGEFLSLEMSGSFLADDSPAFPAGQMVYWFDNVLVFLATQLGGSQAFEDGIGLVFGYCRKYRPASCVDAVLMSIKHVILIRVLANGKIEHSGLLPLFDITKSLRSELESCYRCPDLASQLEEDWPSEDEDIEPQSSEAATEKQRAFPADRKNNTSQPNEPSIQSYRFRVKGTNKSTFCALAHILDAAARRHMSPLAIAREGIFPNEIYTQILAHVTDFETRTSCQDVCRTFRNYCQEHLLFSANTTLEPTRDIETCVQPGHIPRTGFTLSHRLVDEGVKTRQVDFESQRIVLDQYGYYIDNLTPSWTIAVGGAGRDRGILLEKLKVRFVLNRDAGRASVEGVRHLVARNRGGDQHRCTWPGCKVKHRDSERLDAHYRYKHLRDEARRLNREREGVENGASEGVGLGPF